MIFDLDKIDNTDDPRLHCDVCIVGGGAVGLALAATLADSGVTVLVLEGGGTRIETESQDLHRVESVGRPFDYMESGRYRVVGGTTTFWGGQVYPFDRLILDGRPWLAQEPWPVPPQEMQDWYDRTYHLLGLGDAILDDGDVWKAIKLNLPDFAPELQMVVTRWVRQRNFARLFGSHLRRASGPHVLAHANVTALGLDPGRQRIARAVVRSLRGRQAEITAGRFVLANGTLEIARLLLHPLADGSRAPWADSPWLGTPLMDHLDCIAADVHILDQARFHDLFDNAYCNGYKYFPKLRLAPGTQKSENLVDIAAQFHYRTRMTEHINYLKMFLGSIGESSADVRFSELAKHVRALAVAAWPLARRYIRDRRSFKPRDSEVSLALYSEQLPAPGSRIMLADTRDGTGMRRIRVDWRIDGRELRSMQRFAQIIRDDLGRLGLARVEIAPALEAGSPSFLDNVHDAVHQMGTARMGRDRSDGVVDSDLRVFDTDNLYVAGAATFAGAGFANPTFTAIALALRLADHLARSRPA